MKNVLIFLFSFFVIASCASDDSNETNPVIKTKTDTLDPIPVIDETSNSKITYEGNIRAIINRKCTQCHAIRPSQGAPFSLVNYDDVTNRDTEERIGVRATQGTMPPKNTKEAPLTTEEVNLINQWIRDGALEK